MRMRSRVSGSRASSFSRSCVSSRIFVGMLSDSSGGIWMTFRIQGFRGVMLLRKKLLGFRNNTWPLSNDPLMLAYRLCLAIVSGLRRSGTLMRGNQVKVNSAQGHMQLPKQGEPFCSNWLATWTYLSEPYPLLWIDELSRFRAQPGLVRAFAGP